MISYFYEKNWKLRAKCTATGQEIISQSIFRFKKQDQSEKRMAGILLRPSNESLSTCHGERLPSLQMCGITAVWKLGALEVHFTTRRYGTKYVPVHGTQAVQSAPAECSAPV